MAARNPRARCRVRAFPGCRRDRPRRDRCELPLKRRVRRSARLFPRPKMARQLVVGNKQLASV